AAETGEHRLGGLDACLVVLVEPVETSPGAAHRRRELAPRLARDALDLSHASERRLGEADVAEGRHAVVEAPLPRAAVAFDRAERFQEARVGADARAAHPEALGELLQPRALVEHEEQADDAPGRPRHARGLDRQREILDEPLRGRREGLHTGDSWPK